MRKKVKIYPKIGFALLLIISLCSMLFFSILSPYEEWDPNVKQVDYDVLDSLVFVWLVIFLLNIIGVIITRTYKKYMFIFVVFQLISLVKLISLIWLYIV